MKKLLLFFTKPLVSGALALIGTLELLWSIPSKYFVAKVEIWIILLTALLILFVVLIWKRIRILYYVRTYTSGTFGSSYMYEWRWVKTNNYPNIYGYFPDYIRAMAPPIANPTLTSYDFGHHYIGDTGKLQKYIMLGLFDKVEDTKQTNTIMVEIHRLESNNY